MINFSRNVCNIFDTIQIVFLSLINPGAAAMDRFDLRRPKKKLGFPWWLSGKESDCQAGDAGSSLGREDPREKELQKWKRTPIFLLG